MTYIKPIDTDSISIEYSNKQFSYYLTIADTKFVFASSDELTAAINIMKRVARLFDSNVKIKAIGKTVVISNKQLTVKINMYKLI